MQKEKTKLRTINKKENKTDLTKLQRLLREELDMSWVTRDGELWIIHRHLTTEVKNIQDVQEVNLKYEMIKNQFQSIDMRGLIFSLPRAARIEKFEIMSEDIYEFHGEEYYFQLLASIITDINYFGTDKHKLTDLIFNSQSTINYLMYEEELEEFKQLPENLTIYRGVALQNLKDDLEGYLSVSWTLDFEIAKWFANRNIGYPVVFKYEIKKENVLAYFTVGNESEILINHEMIDFLDVEIDYLF